MTSIEAQVPDYLARLARDAAAKENVSVDQIVALALASQVSAWHVRDDPDPLTPRRPSHSDRFRCGGRESKFLAVTAAKEPAAQHGFFMSGPEQN